MDTTDPVDHPGLSTLLRLAGDTAAIVAAFESVPTVLSYFEGPDMVIRAANAVCRAMYRRDDVIGMPVGEVVPAAVGQELIETLQRVLAEQRDFVGVEWRMVLDRSDPNSEVFLNFTLIPVLHPDGRSRGVVVQAVDVTREVLARRAAQVRIAGAEQKLEAAERVLFTLQRHLLPDAVPVLPQVRLAARYLVAEAELQAGGDWFDAVPLGDGRVGLVVGDVVGHGAEAAAAMARLQTVLHEALLQPDASIGDAVQRLDVYAARTPTTRAATVCIAIIDPTANTITYLCRAHPPPLVCRPDGSAEFLPDTHGGPLGVHGSSPSPVTAKLEPGDVVLLYTDGLIERPGETMRDGLDRLARVATAAIGTDGRTTPRSLPDRLTTLAVERITRMGYHDDVTVLAAHLLPEPAPPLLMDVRADPGELAGVREAITDWIAPFVVRPEDALGVILAVCEAATNVVEHAYSGATPGRLGVAARLDTDGVIRITVDDDGRWRTSTDTTGGRGIGLMRAVCDEVVIDSGSAGTRVDLFLQPQHPTVLGRGDDEAVPVAATHDAFHTTETRGDGERPRLTVHGPVDATTTPLLLATVQRYATAALIIDLGPVTLLASAGVQLLYQLTGEHPIELRAPAGSVARYILDLTDLGSRVRP